MARATYIETLFGSLDAPIRRALKQAFTYLLDNLRFGRPEHSGRAENLQAYFFSGTTPSTANEEFSIIHGLGRAPYLAIPVLPLDAGATFVRLHVPRAPDGNRIYLTSPETNAPITILVEG